MNTTLAVDDQTAERAGETSALASPDRLDGWYFDRDEANPRALPAARPYPGLRRIA